MSFPNKMEMDNMTALHNVFMGREAMAYFAYERKEPLSLNTNL